MMKIAYFAHWLDSPESGVFRKIRMQIQIWQEQGIDCRLFLLTSNNEYINLIYPFPIIAYLYNSFAKRFISVVKLVKAIKDWSPNVIYCRYSKYYPGLGTLAQRFPVIAEINSNDQSELLLRSKISYWYDSLTREQFLGRTTGLVFVTHELSRMDQFSRFRKPYEVIANGVNLEEYKVLPETNNIEPCLVFLGSPGQPWHGLDRILFLAYHFPNWNFEVIGPSFSDFHIEKKIPKNIILRGYLSRFEYEQILANADIGIGTLALERKKMNEACPLKVREYLAYGLPVLIGYKDTDFSEGSHFLFQLLGDNFQTWDLSAMESFVYQWRNRRVPHEEVTVIDSKQKEIKRLNFLKKFI
jgi:hypothetical protein